MKVMVKQWGSLVKEMELSSYLTPTDYFDEGGIAESAAARSRVACETIGKLLALLAEKKLLTLDECCDVAGVIKGDIVGEPL